MRLNVLRSKEKGTIVTLNKLGFITEFIGGLLMALPMIFPFKGQQHIVPVIDDLDKPLKETPEKIRWDKIYKRWFWFGLSLFIIGFALQFSHGTQDLPPRNQFTAPTTTINPISPNLNIIVDQNKKADGANSLSNVDTKKHNINKK